jgi:hypothetical protein
MEASRTIQSGSDFGSFGADGVEVGIIVEARIQELFPCRIFQQALQNVDPCNY